MLSSDNVAFHSAHVVLVFLFWFPRNLLSVFYALSKRECRAVWHRGWIDLGNNTACRHICSADLGPDCGSHRRAQPHSCISHHRYGARLLRTRRGFGFLADCAGHRDVGAGGHSHFPDDDIGEPGDLARCRPSRFWLCPRMGNDRLFHCDHAFSLDAAEFSAAPRARCSLGSA